MAYGAGFAAMIPFFNTDLYRGPVATALGGADIAMLIGLPVSAMVYLLACRSLDLRREAVLIATADRGLDPPPAMPLHRPDWHDIH
jgi:nucleobase:cation symporter-1, NCS1 family